MKKILAISIASILYSCSSQTETPISSLKTKLSTQTGVIEKSYDKILADTVIFAGSIESYSGEAVAKVQATPYLNGTEITIERRDNFHFEDGEFRPIGQAKIRVNKKFSHLPADQNFVITVNERKIAFITELPGVVDNFTFTYGPVLKKQGSKLYLCYKGTGEENLTSTESTYVDHGNKEVIKKYSLNKKIEIRVY